MSVVIFSATPPGAACSYGAAGAAAARAARAALILAIIWSWAALLCSEVNGLSLPWAALILAIIWSWAALLCSGAEDGGVCAAGAAASARGGTDRPDMAMATAATSTVGSILI